MKIHLKWPPHGNTDTLRWKQGEAGGGVCVWRGGQEVIRSTAEWRLMRGLERWEEGGEGKAAAAQAVTNVARTQTLTNAAEGKLMDQNVGLPEEWSPAEEKVSKHYSSDRR